jgi:hypothetical protein
MTSGPRRSTPRAGSAGSVPIPSRHRQSTAGAAHTAHGRASSCLLPPPSSASLSVLHPARGALPGEPFRFLAFTRTTPGHTAVPCLPLRQPAQSSWRAASAPGTLPSLPCDDPSRRPVPPERMVAPRGCGAASRTHQADAGAERIVCLEWQRWGDRVLYCPAGITAHAGGLTSMCLVLNTAEVEVIPTNDLPPSTTP